MDGRATVNAMKRNSNLERNVYDMSLINSTLLGKPSDNSALEASAPQLYKLLTGKNDPYSTLEYLSTEFSQIPTMNRSEMNT